MGLSCYYDRSNLTKYNNLIIWILLSGSNWFKWGCGGWSEQVQVHPFFLRPPSNTTFTSSFSFPFSPLTSFSFSPPILLLLLFFLIFLFFNFIPVLHLKHHFASIVSPFFYQISYWIINNVDAPALSNWHIRLPLGSETKHDVLSIDNTFVRESQIRRLDDMKVIWCNLCDCVCVGVLVCLHICMSIYNHLPHPPLTSLPITPPIMIYILLRLLLLMVTLLPPPLTLHISYFTTSKAKRNPVAVAQALANLTRAAGKMKKANIAANKGGSPYAQSTIAGRNATQIQ